MRGARIKADGGGYYHCMSRIIEGRLLLQTDEKERLLKLMSSLAAFGGLHILAYAFMSNHFHILVHVPERQEVSDAELLKRLGHIHPDIQVAMIARQLEDYRRFGQHGAAEDLKRRFTYRMYDVSEFFKAFKQQFSQYFNAKTGRSGPLWEQRFKSVLVEESEDALMTIAAYIDLNPVRAGMTADPKDYRYSTYGAAVGGSKAARSSLRRLMKVALGQELPGWGEAQAQYRQRLYVQGAQRGLSPQGRPLRSGFSPNEVEKVLAAGGKLPMHDLLRCRVRYFTDGLALGSQEFVEGIFARYRARFGPNRKTGARPMRFAQATGLFTLRDLRLAPVTGP